jgi:hypothetical protein
MPRYVILEHDHPQRHWDMMLEAGEMLRTWRLAAPPQPGQAVLAEASFAHRAMYLDYEGPVRGGRGHVVRWDAGSFTWVADESDQVRVHLEGGRCRGLAVLRRNADQGWSLTLREDRLGAGEES